MTQNPKRRQDLEGPALIAAGMIAQMMDPTKMGQLGSDVKESPPQKVARLAREILEAWEQGGPSPPQA